MWLYFFPAFLSLQKFPIILIVDERKSYKDWVCDFSSSKLWSWFKYPLDTRLVVLYLSLLPLTVVCSTSNSCFYLILKVPSLDIIDLEVSGCFGILWFWRWGSGPHPPSWPTELSTGSFITGDSWQSPLVVAGSFWLWS